MGPMALATTSVLADALTGVSLAGITTEMVGVLPLVLPVYLTVIAIRKGISMLSGMLRGA